MIYDAQFRWTSAARTHVGLVRQINEDSCLDYPETGLWAVADGMGGHALGDFASRMIVESLSKIPQADSVAKLLSNARRVLLDVNHKLRTEAAMRGAHIIGSTVVVLAACDRYCGYLWAGDSRIYLYRDGRLSQLSRDHSQLEELRLSGTLLAEDIATHPARSMITRAVGAADVLDLDEETLTVNEGDVFLLCSDGLSNEISEEEMCSALVAGDCHVASEILVDMALKRGGRDNISAVVVRADDTDSVERTMLNPAI